MSRAPLPKPSRQRTVQFMKTRRSLLARMFFLLSRLLLLVATPNWAAGQPAPAATTAYNAYIATLENRLARQHRSPESFLAPTPPPDSLVPGRLVVEQLTPAAGSALPGALLHHWRATAFAPGAHLQQFDRLLLDIDAYPHVFAPEVLQARVLARQGDTARVSMRVQQHHVLTVVMDSTWAVTSGRLDPQHGFSHSVSTDMAEISSPGTAAERQLDAAHEHGFLWRQNTYWTFEERDGGLYVQLESVSLSRSIPRGLGWAVQPFVQSIPRDSLEFTLRSVLNAMRR